MRKTFGVEGEADGDDRVVALGGKQREELLTVGAARVGGELPLRDAKVSDGLRQARVGGVVERLVALAADVEDQADLGVALDWSA